MLLTQAGVILEQIAGMRKKARAKKELQFQGVAIRVHCYGQNCATAVHARANGLQNLCLA